MHIDWQRTINDILEGSLTCRRCGAPCTELIAGYSRLPEAAAWSPRSHECDQPEQCDARKLIFVCLACARDLRLRPRRVDEEGMMAMLLEECRRELEDAIDYLADHWMDDFDTDPERLDLRLEDVSPEVFAEEAAWRDKLEREYLQLHRWFREQGRRVPDPGWRSEYVEELVALGYPTLLGD